MSERKVIMSYVLSLRVHIGNANGVHGCGVLETHSKAFTELLLHYHCTACLFQVASVVKFSVSLMQLKG